VAVDEFIISGSKSLNFLFSYFIYLKLIHSSIHQPHLLVLKQAFLRKPQKKKKKNLIITREYLVVRDTLQAYVISYM
jgi:ATP adenylyltransferase/5',5'''-P-1,P-4-tetraphosphate phosphorylase II